MCRAVDATVSAVQWNAGQWSTLASLQWAGLSLLFIGGWLIM